MDLRPEVKENTATLGKLRDENRLSREQLEKTFKEPNGQVMGIASQLTLTLQQQTCEQLHSKIETLQGSSDHLQAETDTLKEELSEFKELNEWQPLLPEETGEASCLVHSRFFFLLILPRTCYS
jgi:chromosome segregation ATPase